MFDGGGEEGAWVFKGTPREAENLPEPTFRKNQRSWQSTRALPGPERASIDAPSAALSLAGRFPALLASVSGCQPTLRQPAPQNQELNGRTRPKDKGQQDGPDGLPLTFSHHSLLATHCG